MKLTSMTTAELIALYDARIAGRWAALCVSVAGAGLFSHIACDNGPAVIGITLNSGVTLTRNARGRCEDAPCCGCCS